MKKLTALLGIMSLALLVLTGCDGGEQGAPTNFTLTAGTDGITVELSWDAPEEGEPDEYIVYFADAAETTITETSYTHDPDGETGDYYVAAVWGEEEYDSDILTTTPVHSSDVTIYELEASGNAGYGWDISDDFDGSTYSMAEATNASLVDFYVTNFTDDPAGGPWPTPYNIASPDEAPNDPGGSFVPQASWRQNWFSDPITDPQAPLPEYTSTYYFNYTEIDVDPIYIAAYLHDEDYYALVKFTGENATDGSIQVETWIQSVPGLRLIAH